MKNSYYFQFTAFSDAAGKYDPTAPKEGNEDNLFYSLNLSEATSSNQEFKEWLPLNELGLLMVVADGMGGMNAGEVASQIAIDTVKFFFSPGKLTKKMAENDSSRQAYLEKVIVAADEQVKQMATQREDRKGMGSTLILLWLYKDRLTLSWIGDSRAYRYNEKVGLQPLSKDHSFVQELVDKGDITYEQSFDHPQGNIITRSLGDPTKKAKPDTRHFKVYDGDVILLCSDGLSGVLRDNEIQSIIADNYDSVHRCQEELWKAARDADWYDNVTTLLCKFSGGDKCSDHIDLVSQGEVKPFWKGSIHVKKTNLALITILLLLIIVGLVWVILLRDGENEDSKEQTPMIEQSDNLPVENEDTLYKDTATSSEDMLPQNKPDVTDGKSVRSLDKERPSTKTEEKDHSGKINLNKNGLTPILSTSANEDIVQDTLNADRDSTTTNKDSIILTKI